MRLEDPTGVKPKRPGLAALLGGVCIGAGLLCIGRYKTGVASIAVEVGLLWMWYHYHILWSLWLLAVLWYWQVWFGYEKAEQFNEELEMQIELWKSMRPFAAGKSP